MHPLNKALYQLGVMMVKTRDRILIPLTFHRHYLAGLAALHKDSRGFRVFFEERYDLGQHPESFIDQECAFASMLIQRHHPERILDVGSYRHFILGLLAHAPVTTLDVRARSPVSPNETVITCDAKRLTLASATFDMVISLCSLEHFGLGRYGDELDLDADREALAEMTRVLKPGGRLVFSTTLTGGPAQIVFNAHRIYDLARIHAMCASLTLEGELFFSYSKGRPCSHKELVRSPEAWDVYLGCWRKPA